MTGLDKILTKIAEQSQLKCDEIDAASKKEAQALWEKSLEQADSEAKSIVADAQKKADAIIAAGKSSADAAFRKLCLGAKNDIINDVIAAAYEKLTALDDKDYFDVLISLCAANCQAGTGMMHLSKNDLKRLPKNFEKILGESIGSDSSVIICNKTADIENGFVLSYGDVEINCTFRALFDGMRDELKDIVCPILFADAG